MNTALYSKIESDISRLPKPLIVGISGNYTSGKTVFAETLSQYLTQRGQKVQTVHFDDFHNPLSTIEWTGEKGSEVDAFYYDAFNTQKLIDEILRPVRVTGCADKDVACLNWATGQYSNTVHFAIDGDTVVLLEGVLLFRPPLCGFIDYRIFLDITPQEMLRRGAIRDVPKAGEGILEKYRTRYLPVYEKHLKKDRPKESADVIIDNNNYLCPRIMR